MKPILYSPNETSFENNGIGILNDCCFCKVTEEANGIFELEMEYPMDGIHFEEIATRSIIKAKPNKYATGQLFRIYEIEKSGMSGIAKIYAQHISYDLSGIPVAPFSATNAVDAMNGLKKNSVVENPFNFWTDKAVDSDFSLKTPSSVRSVLGGFSKSLLDVYGGEYEFDNFDVKLHVNRGVNRGVSIRYGKNLTDIEQDHNCSSVYTGVYPFWTDIEQSVIVELPEKIIEADGEYGFTRILVLDLSAEYIEQPTEEDVRNRATSYIKNNKVGIPEVSLTVSYAQLSESAEHMNFMANERVDLFDDVNVEFPMFKVSSTAKVVQIVYNVILDRVDSVTLGSIRANISDTIAKQEEKIENIKTETKTELQKVQESATAWLTNGKGYAYFRKDEAGNIVDILFMDTQDVETAVNVMRVGQSGIGFSNNGVGGPYYSAWTIDGHFNADFITAGTLNAALIDVVNLIAEQLQSVKGDSVLNASGAQLTWSYKNKKTIEFMNQYAPVPILFMVRWDDNLNAESTASYTATSVGLGGLSSVEHKLVLEVDPKTGNSFVSINGIRKKIAWKDNGDGTHSLIGE